VIARGRVCPDVGLNWGRWSFGLVLGVGRDIRRAPTCFVSRLGLWRRSHLVAWLSTRGITWRRSLGELDSKRPRSRRRSLRWSDVHSVGHCEVLVLKRDRVEETAVLTARVHLRICGGGGRELDLPLAYVGPCTWHPRDVCGLTICSERANRWSDLARSSKGRSARGVDVVHRDELGRVASPVTSYPGTASATRSLVRESSSTYRAYDARVGFEAVGHCFTRRPRPRGTPDGVGGRVLSEGNR
jgi:hypothetical protein